MEPWSLGCSEANPQATAASELAEKSRASDPGFDRHLETNRMAVLWLPGLVAFFNSGLLPGAKKDHMAN